jgi:hypothetical protein
MTELLHFHGEMCNNCVELNAGDYLVGIIILAAILIVARILRYIRSRKA